MDISSIAFSGLYSASQRLQTSADTIANQHITGKLSKVTREYGGYQPATITQSAIQPTGEVQTLLRTANHPKLSAYAASNSQANKDGYVGLPDVSAAEGGTLNRILATYNFKANLKSLQAEDDIRGTLVDMLA